MTIQVPPATSDIRLAEDAAALPPEWDALAGPGACHLSTAYLRMSEAYARVPTRYLLYYQGNELAGGLAATLAGPAAPWLFTRTDTALEFSALEDLPGAAACFAALTGGQSVPRTVEEATRAVTGEQPAAPITDLLMPSLLCGGRHFNRTRVLTRDDAAGGQAVIRDLVSRAEDLAGDLGARSIAFLYIDEQDTRLRQELAGRGYFSCASSRHAKLFLPDGGFDGYKATLHRKQRQSITAERRKLAAAGVEVSLEPLTDSLIESLADLESRLFTRHGGSWSPQQSADALTAILTEFGPGAFVIAARMDGALCAFALILEHRRHWYTHRGGFDFDRIGDLPVYFEITFNSVIERAAAAGVQTIHYGAEALRAKELRGCSVVTYHLAGKLLPGNDQR